MNKVLEESFYKSSFTLTFVIEIVGIEVWHDCNEGWLDLGNCSQGLKIQYQLYPGHVFDLDILIWPHCVKPIEKVPFWQVSRGCVIIHKMIVNDKKNVYFTTYFEGCKYMPDDSKIVIGMIWCDTNNGWVRTWQFLERRWFAFSIRHAFPVRVLELQHFVATVSPTPGIGALSSTAKNDNNVEVFLPPLKFGQQRYFGSVLVPEQVENINIFIQELIWETVKEFIPPSFLDGEFNVPHPVNDVRHQDAVIYNVREIILNKHTSLEENEPDVETEESKTKPKVSKLPPKIKESEIPKKKDKAKYEIKLSGDAILAGAGRITSFEETGDRPPEISKMVVLISSNNLPAQDDLPIVFVNIENICQIPVPDFKKARIQEIYTLWRLGEEVHRSETKQVKSKTEIAINDHHAVPLQYDVGSTVLASFLDKHFEIELRGILKPAPTKHESNFFGYDSTDKDFDITVPVKSDELLDVIIAISRVKAEVLAKGINGIVRGEFPLYAPHPNVVPLNREAACTNDINAIRSPTAPIHVVPPHVILEEQMSIEVCMGFVGCRPPKMCRNFSRLFCTATGHETSINLLRKITEINEILVMQEKKEEMLTGFALDTGNKMLFYVEGVRDGTILQVWDFTEDFFPDVLPTFSTSDEYPNRIYGDLIYSAAPFIALKMCVPLNLLLACPQLHARPALPLPCRNALLKIGRILGGKLRKPPCRCEMPSLEELRSFRIELCSPPRPQAVLKDDHKLKLIYNTF